jgi:ornithine cyclodeaminase/alanine dehydrogenase-like protein (mu-crystallin family)
MPAVATVFPVATPCLLVDAGQVRRILDVDTTRHAVEAAFRTSVLPGATPPSTAGLHAPLGTFHVKSALNVPGPGEPRRFVAKINANFPANPAHHGLPTIQGLLVLFDADRGLPLAVMDSGSVTVLRTAAATAVAVQHLALPDASTMAIIGCGAQAAAQVAAVLGVRPIRDLVVHDADPAAAARFAQRAIATFGIRALVATSVLDAARGCAIVVTATTASSAFLGPDHVQPGCLVAAIGADNPAKHEIDPALMAAAAVITDQTAQCAMIGDLHHAIDAGAMTAGQVRAELGAVVAEPSIGRRSPDEVIVFDSTGLAFQDVAAATIVYERLRDDAGATAFTFAARPAEA